MEVAASLHEWFRRVRACVSHINWPQDVVMFRFSFYVGFIEDYQLLLLKNELDEAYKDHSYVEIS